MIYRHELITLMYYDFCPASQKLMQKILGRMPEIEFINLVNNNTGMRIDRARRNTYFIL